MLKSQIESLLFISARPLSVKQLAQLTGAKSKEIETVLAELMSEYNQAPRGMQVIHKEREFQMATSPRNAKLVQKFLQEEMDSELTRPQLETLTIIAYRGPLTKPELENIRGINCSLVLRNLMIRGLAETKEDKDKGTMYSITFDFLRYLGVNDVRDLPDYEKLSKNESLEKLLAENTTTL